MSFPIGMFSKAMMLCGQHRPTLYQCESLTRLYYLVFLVPNFFLSGPFGSNAILPDAPIASHAVGAAADTEKAIQMRLSLI